MSDFLTPPSRRGSSALVDTEKLFGMDNIHMDSLLDGMTILFDECMRPEMKREPSINHFIQQFQPTMAKVKELRPSANDFQTKRILGRGAYGEVKLVTHKFTGLAYAMKVMNKWTTWQEKERAFFMEERDILARADRNWIVGLQYAFHDEENLYLVMDFMQGGDMLGVLEREENALLSDSSARFYFAEMCCSINALHEMGYVHRDIKPENFLITDKGHVRLADFGTCAKLDHEGLVRSMIAVGTPEYVSPEVLDAMYKGDPYGIEVDFWMLGIQLYELLTGCLPFEGDDLIVIYDKIQNHKNTLEFPDIHPETDAPLEISSGAESLIRALLTDKSKRLNFDGIKNHEWFKGFSWDDLPQQTAPFVPEVKSETDTSHFLEEHELPTMLDDRPQGPRPDKNTKFSGNLPFVGYSFSRDPKGSKAKSPKRQSGGLESTKLKKYATVGAIDHDDLKKQFEEKERTLGIERQLAEDKWLDKIRELTEKNAELHHSYEKQSAELQETYEKINARNNEESIEKEQIAQLKIKLDNQNEEIKKMTASMEAAKNSKEKEDLQKEMDLKNKELEKVKTEFSHRRKRSEASDKSLQLIYDQQLKTIAKTKEDIERETAEITYGHRQLEAALKNKSDSLTDKQLEIKRLQRKSVDNGASYNVLLSKFQDQSKKLEKMEAENKKLSTDSRTKDRKEKNELQKTKEEIAKLQETNHKYIQKRTDEYNKQSKELEKIKLELSAQQGLIAERQQVLRAYDDLKVRYEILEKKSNVDTNKGETKEEDSNVLKYQLSQWKAKYENEISKTAKEKAELMALRREIGPLKQKNDEHKKKIMTQSIEVSKLRNEIKKTKDIAPGIPLAKRNTKTESSEDDEVAAAAVTSLPKVFTSAHSELESLRKEKAKLQKQIVSLQEHKTLSNATLKDRMKESEAIKKENEELHALLDKTAPVAFEETIKEIRVANLKIEALEGKVKNMQEHLDIATSSLEEKDEEVELMNEALKRSEFECNMISVECNQAKSEIENLKEETEGQQAQLEDLEDELKAKYEECEELNEQIETANQEIENKNLEIEEMTENMKNMKVEDDLDLDEKERLILLQKTQTENHAELISRTESLEAHIQNLMKVVDRPSRLNRISTALKGSSNADRNSTANSPERK